jgi:hypothetical protein
MVELNDNFVRFSELMGVHMKKDRNGQIVSITTLKKPAIEMEEGLADPLELINQNNHDHSEYSDDYEQEYTSKEPPKKGYFQQKSKMMSSFRMLMFLQSISEIPIATLQKEPGNYQIEVHLLDQVFKYKIEPQYLEKQSEDMCRINMNRFCMKYFFSEQRTSLRSFIQKEKVRM